MNVTGFTGDILIIVDITDPARPREVSRWWYPGQRAGETPDWNADPNAVPRLDVQAHDITVYRDRAYVAWRDKGLIILDIGNIANPTRVGEINWSIPTLERPFVLSGQTHSFGVVVPKGNRRPSTLVSTDEVGACPYGYPHFLDISNEQRPTEISVFQLPLNLHGNCPPHRPGRRFGVHDVERLIRGDIVWSAWEEAGFWGINIRDIHAPRAAAYFVPPVRSDSPERSRSGHADGRVRHARRGDLRQLVGPRAGGFWAMRYKPGFEGTVRWNAEEDDVIVRHGRGR